MPTKEAIDATLRLHIDLMRVDASLRRKVFAILGELENDLVGRIPRTEWSKARINKQLEEVRSIIKASYSDIATEGAELMAGIASVSASSAAAGLVAGADVAPVLPNAEALKSLARNAVIQGATQAAWWKRQSDDTAWRFAREVNQGIAAAETTGQIIQRIRGRAGFPGVMKISRANAAALVQTSVQTVANEARLATMEANEDLYDGYVWVATLDSHTCPQCAPRDGLKWDTKKRPIGHSMPFKNPPIHFNDRCVLVPDVKEFKGFDGGRVSEFGDVSSKTTFSEFLARQSKEYQEDVLGKGRAELFRAKKITLQDLIDGRGNELTLAELKRKYS